MSLHHYHPGTQHAGTDHDDDNFICDGGEACGAFPSLSSPAVLRIDARASPPLLVASRRVNVYDLLQFSICPGSDYELEVQLTKDVATFLLNFFSLVPWRGLKNCCVCRVHSPMRNHLTLTRRRRH